MTTSGVARIWCEGAQVEAPKAPRGVEWGGGVPLPTGGEVCAPSAENFLNFSIKMVSSGAFWVAISYLSCLFYRNRKYVWG